MPVNERDEPPSEDLKKQLKELQEAHERGELDEREFRKAVSKLTFQIDRLVEREKNAPGQERARGQERKPDFFLD